MKYEKSIRLSLLLICSVFILQGCGGYGSYNQYDTYDSYSPSYEYEYEYDDDAVRENINGTYDVDVCGDSGCYTVEADISDGELDTIYFDNGGQISDPENEGWYLDDLPEGAYDDARDTLAEDEYYDNSEQNYYPY